MREFQVLSELKSALIDPIRAQLKRSLWEALPEPPSTTASSLATRHDHHNIEIKTVCSLSEQPSLVETDIFLFFPRTFEIRSLGKAELSKDFRSRMRLALPSSAELGSAAFESALKTLRLSLHRVELTERFGDLAFDLNHPLSEELTEAAKDLCAVIAETLKHSAVDSPRHLLLSHKVGSSEELCTHGLEQFTAQIRVVREMIARVREVLDQPRAATVTALELFDEYLSQIFVHFLGTIRQELARIGLPESAASSIGYRSRRVALDSLLDELQETEALRRRRFMTSGQHAGSESELERERRLVRLSHLKKFFQSRTFVEISRQQAAKRLSESTAAAGTAAAGIVAALLERFSQPGVAQFAFSGLFVISFGVIMYVLRDRLKDYAKAIFQEKASKFLPDFEQQLIAKEKKIGTAKEWFRVIDAKSLPDKILALRHKASASEMEERLPEDVFHCRKVQELHGSLPASVGSLALNRALLENTRINFERHLKHMDDPFKEMTDLDFTGNFTRSRSHRVYHFYLCVRTCSTPLVPSSLASQSLSLPARLLSRRPYSPPRSEQNTVYRIVLDKNGVVRLEEIMNDLTEGPAPEPTSH